MYSYEDRIRAVKFYITCGYNAAYTVSKLGYPDASNLKHWYKEYSESNDLHKGRKKVSKFSDREKRDAVDYYFAHDRNALQTVKALGYPSRPLLIQWVKELCPEEGKRRCKSFKSHVRCSQEEKIQAVMESCKGNLKIAQIAEIYGVTPSAVSVWRKELLGEGKTLKMIQPPAEDKSIEQLIREKAELEAKVKRLENDVYKLQLERDILEKAGDILKKEEGINLDQLTNREKVFLIDALRNKYKLNELLPVLKLSKSSYCYQVQCIKSKDKYKELRQQIKELFMCNKEIYGYRRIHCLLRKDGIIVSEKIVRRIMNEEQLIVKAARKRKYNSYKGEITPEVDNIIKRDFSAKKPNEKWLTDITEFHIPAGKIYLSPIIDCFDGMVVSWTIGTSPNSKLANTMLQKAIEQLDPSEHPLVHSDRGCHYRWPEWINLMDTAGLTRSMSKKGCSPDNSACEGFFGRLKNEMFYGRNWNHASIDSFIHKLDPRTKILITFVFIITLFFINKFYGYIFVVIFLGIVILLSKLSFKYIYKGVKPIFILILITAVLNVFLVTGTPETLVFKLGFISIYTQGIKTAIFMALRLIFLIMGTSIMTLTTSPIELTDGIEKLLAPFKKVGLPAHELAMMMTIALRFIPTLIDETDKIMKAQQARGADFETGNLVQKAKNLIPLLVPLFISSFRRADELAMAMEARCYRGGEGRTRMKQLKLEKKDAIAFVVYIVFLILCIVSRFGPSLVL